MCVLGIAVYYTVGCRSYEYAVIPNTHKERGRKGGRESQRKGERKPTNRLRIVTVIRFLCSQIKYIPTRRKSSSGSPTPF